MATKRKFDDPRPMTVTGHELKVNDYVTDSSDSGRHYKQVHRITGFSFDRAICEYVGHVMPGGRIEYSRQRHVTHRNTADLRKF